MFTGIIETTGTILAIEKELDNRHFVVASALAPELKIDQSLAHNGVCLTVIAQNDGTHTVTAIAETLQKTNFDSLMVGDTVNLERCMPANARFDGHIVQGHTDLTAICTQKLDQNGSWLYTFEYPENSKNITVEKGSICVNGVSLTVVNSQKNSFSVCIIPYTYEFTNFNQIEIGNSVNLEFDILGKYIQKIMEAAKT